VTLAERACGAVVEPRDDRTAELIAIEDVLGTELDADAAGLAEFEVDDDRLGGATLCFFR
jgi:hypothetical protein